MKSTCVGILRETESSWEKRVPLNPISCKKLIDKGIKVVIQPSKIRCYSDDEYREIGAEVKEDISESNLIICLNCPSVLISDSTYMLYSHTGKGQLKNHSFLESILEKKIRLIDYECIRECETSKRLISFGRIAGIAGTINILKGIGELLLARQISTPFIFTKLSYMYTCLKDAKESLSILGNYIKEQFLAEKYCPFVIGILGNGQVSSGVQEALRCLPHKFITPKELLTGNLEKLRDTIFVVVFEVEDLYENRNNGTFNRSEFIKSPEFYISKFETTYLKHIHILINALYWESRYSKILTKSNLKDIMSKHDCNLLGIADITCDLKGSIEILNKYTNYNNPFFIYEPILEKYITDVDHSTNEGIMYHAIPNLAASFSTDASDYFSNMLLPYIESLSKSSYPNDRDNEIEIPEEIKKAIITSNGSLTELYKNIFKYSDEKIKLQSMICINSQKPYYVSLKMRGHLFDTGFFNFFINLFANYDLSHKINFISIGDSTQVPSVLYVDVNSSSKDILKEFMTIIKEKIELNELELDIIKNNLY